MKKIVLMMGAPASGKSTIRNQLFFSIPAIDCDEIKKTIKGFDPKNITDEIHYQSTTIAKKMVAEKILAGESFVYDTTGACAEALVRVIEKARPAGYEILLVYVKCGLRECLKRNKARERSVSPWIVRSKWEAVRTSFEIVSRYVDETLIIDSYNFKKEESK